MGVPKSPEKGMSKKQKRELLKDISLHCRNCREDLEPEQVDVRQAGEDRYFLFCSVCDLFMKTLDWSQPSKVATEVQTASSPQSDGELKQLKEELFLLKKENELLKKQMQESVKK